MSFAGPLTLTPWIMRRRPLGAVARDGFVGAVDPYLDRNVVFWFLLASPLLWIVGRFALWLAAEGRRAPAWLGRDLLIVALVGIVLMPVSGFWLILVPSVLLLATPSAIHRAS